MPFTLIAGPCSAESREQTLSTAEQLLPLTRLQIAQEPLRFIFRAGLWKPRTHPESFSGVGTEGLPWLEEVRERYGFEVSTEVASAEHLESCISSGIHYLWLGARTTANPFLVQRIADYLKSLSTSKKDELTLIVKNPINADIDIWVGAVERLLQSGIEHIWLVHRGFSSATPTQLMRNQPLWSLPIEMHRRFPTLPLLSDPSHLTGDATKVPVVAQQAVSMGFNGLMIEAHCCPKSALSDAQQQLTPQQLIELMNNLRLPKPASADAQLEQYRQSINEVDEQIWELIVQRMDIVKHIGEYKREKGLSVFQHDRYEHILKSRLDWAADHNLSADLVKKIVEAIHEEALRKQL